MAPGRLLPPTGRSGEETLARPGGHGGSPRKLLRRRRGNEEKRWTTAVSDRGGINGSGSGKVTCACSAKELDSVLSGFDGLAFLGQRRIRVRRGMERGSLLRQ
jgi:hypothetical protein